MAVKRVLFIRPGETDWNLHGRWQGWVAVPLNDLGEQQVRRLSGFIRNLGIRALYSSDNRRAAQTAEIIAEQNDFEPHLDERLRERHIGHWQGMILPEVRDWYPDEYQSMMNNLDSYRVPGGGESRADVRKRTSEAFEEYLQQWENEENTITIGIITHTTAIRIMLETLIDASEIADISFGNSSVTTVTREGDGWKLTTVNDTSHLEGLESRYMPEVEFKE